MFEKEAEENKPPYACCSFNTGCELWEDGFQRGAEHGYNKANERHSPDEHIGKDRVVLGIIKFCNKIRYSLVQWNGEWWYQYGSFNAEVRLIAWYNIPELPKEIKENE